MASLQDEDEIFETEDVPIGSVRELSRYPWDAAEGSEGDPVSASLEHPAAPEESTVFVTTVGAAQELDEAALRAHMEQCGQVRSARLVSGGFAALVRYHSADEAQKAMEALPGTRVGPEGGAGPLHLSWTSREFDDAPTVQLSGIRQDRFTVQHGGGAVAQSVASDPSLLSIDRAAPAPAAAFEVFQGRLFAPAERLGAELSSEGRRGGEKVLETPPQKLLRLRRELEALRGEVSRGVSEARAEESPAWAAIRGEAESLGGQLAALASDPRHEKFLGSEPEGAEALTEEIAEAIKRLRLPREAPAAEGQQREGARVLAALDARLFRLESAVGLGPRKSGGVSLRQQLDDLDSRLRMIDEDALKQLRESAAAAKEQVGALKAAAEGSEQWRSAEDAARVEKIWSSMKKWDGVADELPAILNRMQQLHDLHEEAAFFTQRLAALEQDADAQGDALLQAGSMLQDQCTNFEENMNTVKANLIDVNARMKDLAERMAKLG